VVKVMVIGYGYVMVMVMVCSGLKTFVAMFTFCRLFCAIFLFGKCIYLIRLTYKS